jgi:HK97 gp10 family phage protein
VAEGPRFDRLADTIVRELSRDLFGIAEIVAVEAQVSITAGASSGRKTKKHAHVVSRPGEPPNQDSGTLAGNIEVNQIKSLVVEISSNAPYSAALEFGTSKMAARPFMEPARRSTEPRVRQLTAQAVNRAVRKFTRS